MGFRIEALHAWVTVGEDGDEGIIAFQSSMGWLPMISADRIRMEQLRPIAEEQAKTLPNPIKLVRFGTREEIEVLDVKRDDQTKGPDEGPEIAEPSLD
jgi:hypothetical protein